MSRISKHTNAVGWAKTRRPWVTGIIRRSGCVLAAALLIPSARAATMTRAWVRSYDGPAGGSDNAFAIAVDARGDILVAGQSAGTLGSPYVYDCVTLKYSSSGVPLWTNRYHGPGTGSDYIHALAVDAGGNVIVTGESSGLPSRVDFVTIKYSGQGVPLWTNRYRAPADSAIARGVAVDTNNNVLVTGYTYASGLVTIKYAGSGAPLWTNRYVGPTNLDHFARSIAVDRAGRVFVSGYSSGSGTGDDFVTLAYSSTGLPLWTNRYDGPDNGDDNSNAMALDANGNVFVTGGAAAGGMTEFATIKYSNAGVPLWTNRYRGPGGSTYGGASGVVVDRSGDVLVAGASKGSGTYSDFATIKYSSAGVPLWTNRYEGVYDDAVNGLAVDRNGNVFVTGYRTDAYTLRFDCLTVAYSSGGTSLWSDVYNGPGNDDDSGNAIAVDGSGNVFITGYSRGASGLADLLAIKYSTTLVMPPLGSQRAGNSLVLSWANTLFGLRAASNANGTFTNVPGATSPYTNPITGSQGFFRLMAN
jgi:uncharacterized delta-60 repeat protein